MKNFYRKSMLEKLSSPEQLDKLIVIVKPSFWIAIGGGVLIVVLVILWSIFGSLPQKVTVNGIYSPLQEVSLVSSSASGLVHSVEVSSGDVVSKGDVLYTVAGSDGESVEYVPVTADMDGVISSVQVVPGSYISEGTVAAVIRKSTGGHTVYCFVPFENGKKIEVGMKVNVYPTTVSQNEYGHMTATVTEISSYAPSKMEVLLKLGDESLAEAFLANGSVICVTCTLDEDSSTASGYKWSGKKGEEVYLQDDTLVTADIITNSKRPIEFLFPTLK